MKKNIDSSWKTPKPVWFFKHMNQDRLEASTD